MSKQFTDANFGKSQIRQHMRTLRASLCAKEQQLASHNIAQQARKCNRLLQSKRLLSYAAFGGEISPHVLVQQLNCSNIYLPRITNFRTSEMNFYSSHKPNKINSKATQINRYGIEEPKIFAPPLFANQFDVMLLPLIAFDQSGNRIGMGKGYYDRALKALAHQSSTKPFLIGIAHHFQEVNSCHRERWDVALDAILTDKDFFLIDH